MNVNEALARVGIVLIQAIEPENTRGNQILGARKRVVRAEGHPTLKNGSNRHAVTDLGRHLKISGWRLVTAFFNTDSEARTRDWIFSYNFVAVLKGERLV